MRGAKFARGTHAKAQCQRCSQVIKYLDLRTEWTGLRVCSDCWEPKHPQLTPPRDVGDAEALRRATGYDDAHQGCLKGSFDAIVTH